MMQTNPSPFYDQLEGAEKFTLSFPLTRDCVGPDWLESGELVRSKNEGIETEDIEAVCLGENRYRLAERCLGPFTSLRLYWGDEFLADSSTGNTLILTRVVVPRIYEHYRWLISGGFKNEHPIANLVHEVGGGWETVAVGILTLTVPAARSQEFHSRMNAAGLRSGLLTLED